MSDESYVLDLAKVRQDELSALEKSNIVLAVFCFIFLLSGFPAWLIMQIWVHLHVSSILHMVPAVDAVLFKRLYIMCLGFLLSSNKIELSAEFFRDGSGQVKLVDFSVAISKESNRIGQVVGKPSYMSVDQFRGFAKKTNDLYAIGATLYFLLIGEDPSPVTASRPSLKRPEINSDVDKFVLRCTELNESARFNSIDEVISDLDELQCKRVGLPDFQPEVLLV